MKLAGYKLVDDEGVPTEEVTLVEEGGWWGCRRGINQSISEGQVQQRVTSGRPLFVSRCCSLASLAGLEPEGESADDVFDGLD